MRRPAIPFAVALIVGLWGAREGPEAAPALLSALTVALAVAAILFFGPGRLTGRFAGIVLVATAGVLAGVLLERLHFRTFPAGHVREHLPAAGAAGGERRPAALVGVVVSEPVERRAGARVYASVDLEAESLDLGGGAAPVATNGRVRAWVSGGAPALRHGRRVRIFGQLGAPREPRNPGQFDVGRALARERILATLSVRRDADVAVLEERASGAGPGVAVGAALQGVRDRLRRAVRGALPGEEGALVESMLLGTRETVSEPVVEAFERTGTIHILAISGQHLAVLAAVVWFVLARVLRLPRRAALLATLALAVAYCALVGASPSVLRATIMIGIFLLGAVFRRESDAATSLAVSAVVVLAVDPGDLFSIGFQLSYAAILGLLYLFAPVVALLRRLVPAAQPRRIGARFYHPPARRLADAVALSVAAWLTTGPLVLLHFHLVTPAVVAGNLAALPLAWLLLTAGLALAALSPLAGLAPALLVVPAAVAGVAAKALILLVGALAAAPGAYVYRPDPPVGALAASYAALGLLAAAHRFGLGRRAKLGAALAWLAAAGFIALPGGPGAPRAETRLATLDVGLGTTTVIGLPSGETYLYDCGSSRHSDVGGRIIAPYLWSRGIHRLDGVFLSHADRDHVSGLHSVLDRFPVGAVLVPAGFDATDPGARLLDEIAARGVTIRTLAPGDRIGPGLAVLGPGASSPRPLRSENDRSLVLRLETPSGPLVLAGDIEERGTEALLAAHPSLASAVFLVPHHGSRNDLAPALAARLRPRLAIVSAWEGFADGPTLDAYRAVGSEVLSTAECGAIEVTIDGDGIRVATMFAPPPGPEGGVAAARP